MLKHKDVIFIKSGSKFILHHPRNRHDSQKKLQRYKLRILLECFKLFKKKNLLIRYTKSLTDSLKVLQCVYYRGLRFKVQESKCNYY